MNRNISHAKPGLQAAHVRATERVQTAPNVPVNLVEDALAAFTLIETVRDVLDAEDWDSDTVAQIASILRSYGYEIRDLDY